MHRAPSSCNRPHPPAPPGRRSRLSYSRPALIFFARQLLPPKCRQLTDIKYQQAGLVWSTGDVLDYLNPMTVPAASSRSDKKPTLGQQFLVWELHAAAKKIASGSGLQPLRLLAWTYDEELARTRRSAGKKGGAPQKNWALLTGFSDPVDALLVIHILELLDFKISRALLFRLMVKHASGGAKMLKPSEIRARAKRLKTFHEAPPAEIRAVFDKRKTELPQGKTGLTAELISLADRNLAE